jgi:hypothetical protein
MAHSSQKSFSSKTTSTFKKIRKKEKKRIAMTRHPKRHIGWALVPVFLSCTALAQSPQQPGALQQRIQEMQQATAMNEQQLRGYQWIETTTLTVDGKPRPPQRSLCSYAPDGTLRKTPLQSAVAPQVSGGPLRKHIAEKKIEEFQEKVAQIHVLTSLYLPLNQAKLGQALHGNRVDLERDGTNGSAVLVNDYAKLGDQLRLALNASTMRMERIGVKSYFDQPSDALTADVQFSLLPDGTVYPSVTTITAPAKKISITTVSSDFSKLAY